MVLGHRPNDSRPRFAILGPAQSFLENQQLKVEEAWMEYISSRISISAQSSATTTTVTSST